jgi:hypothetical protein
MLGPTVRAPLTAPDTINRFMVGANVAGQIVILNLPMGVRATVTTPAVDHEGTPVMPALPEWPAVGPLTAEEAINLAAWLVAVSGKRAEFVRLLAAVEST